MYKKIILLMLVFSFFCAGCGDKNPYEEAKNATVKYFNRNTEIFGAAVKTVTEQQSSDGVTVEKIELIEYSAYGESYMVRFNYYEEIFNGKRYWGVYYSSDNAPKCDEAGEDFGKFTESAPGKYGYVHHESSSIKNYYMTERISENWFFYYMDKPKYDYMGLIETTMSK